MADTRAIDPQQCSVCGRGILRGERTRSYVTEGGERADVCELCKDRAAAAGWVSADRAMHLPAPKRRRSRRGAAVRQWLEVARGTGSAAPNEAPPASAATSTPTRTERGDRSTTAHSPARRVRDAVEAFNASEHRRTVTGLSRSLGEPRVSVVPVGRDGAVRMTVAWELSWYQWQTFAEQGKLGVREHAKGSELAELAPGERKWNARAVSGGRLELPPPGLRGSESDEE